MKCQQLFELQHQELWSFGEAVYAYHSGQTSERAE